MVPPDLNTILAASNAFYPTCGGYRGRRARHFDFPALYTWGIVILWVAKDAILYFFLWRAYDPRPPEPMVGLQGIAHEKIDPSGYVSVKGELWMAEVAQGFPAPEKGQAVEVLSVRGLTLTVRPLLQHPIKEDGSQ